MAALEMVVAQDAATTMADRRCCHEIVGEEGHKVQQLAERGPLDLHGGVVVVEDDAVLIVIDIRLYCRFHALSLMVSGMMR